MGRTLNETIASLPKARRRAIKKRTAALIAAPGALRSRGGEMAAKRFAELVRSLSEAGGVARGKAGQGELEQLCEHVVGFFEGDVNRAALWFRLPNPLLGDVSPRDMIRYGRYAKLQQFVVEALADNAVAAEPPPFAIKVPNLETRAAMDEARAMTRASEQGDEI